MSSRIPACSQLPNIERINVRGRHEYRGRSAEGRAFRVGSARRCDGVRYYYALALTPREGMTNRLEGPSLASISDQLDATP